jgi:hypothetical protein
MVASITTAEAKQKKTTSLAGTVTGWVTVNPSSSWNSAVGHMLEVPHEGTADSSSCEAQMRTALVSSKTTSCQPGVNARRLIMWVHSLICSPSLVLKEPLSVSSRSVYDSGRGARDLGMMCFSLVKTFPGQDPRSNGIPPWEPKESFHRVADFFRSHSVASGVQPGTLLLDGRLLLRSSFTSLVSEFLCDLGVALSRMGSTTNKACTEQLQRSCLPRSMFSFNSLTSNSSCAHTCTFQSDVGAHVPFVNKQERPPPTNKDFCSHTPPPLRLNSTADILKRQNTTRLEDSRQRQTASSDLPITAIFSEKSTILRVARKLYNRTEPNPIRSSFRLTDMVLPCAKGKAFLQDGSQLPFWILDLPAELVGGICDHLLDADLINVRSAYCKLNAQSSTAFGQRFFRHLIAILHPSSLTTLYEICRQPVLSKFVH